MKQKIGECECSDCAFPACDVGLDKAGHPYVVCWGECGGSQYFTHGKPPRVRAVLDRMKFRPLPGTDVDKLREKYELKAPAAPPVVLPPLSPAAPPAKKTRTIFG